MSIKLKSSFYRLTQKTGKWLLIALPTMASAGTFSDDLNSGLNSNDWTVTQTTAGLYSLTTTSNGEELTNVGVNPGGFQAIQVSLNLNTLGGNITGDFTAQISFSNAVLGPNNDQVQLNAGFADGSYLYDVRDLSEGNNVHVWNGGLQGVMASSADSGVFEISRTGSILSGFFNGALIFSETDTAALSEVSFNLQNQTGSNDRPSVTFSNFSLTGSTVVPIPAAFWLFASTLAGLIGFNRRKSA